MAFKPLVPFAATRLPFAANTAMADLDMPVFRSLSAIAILLSFACAGPTPAPAARSATPPTPALDVVELSATDALARMAAGTLTAHALTQAYLDRIAAVDDAGPKLNSVIDLN